MAAPPLDEPTFQRLLQAFRDAVPVGNAAAAAKLAKVNVRTARKYWTTGVGDRKAISELLADEAQQARLKAMEESERLKAEAELAAKKAREDAINQRAQEAGLVRYTRTAAQGLLIGTVRMATGIGQLGAKIQQVLTDQAQSSAKLDDKQVDQIISRARRVAHVLDLLSTTTQRAMEMERLLLGEPTQIIGVGVMTMDDAERKVALFNRALDRARARGLVPMAETTLPPSEPAEQPGQQQAAGQQIGVPLAPGPYKPIH